MSSKPRKNKAQEESSLSAEIENLISELRREVKTLRADLQETSKSRPLLTREEAAELLRISTRTLDDMADAGEIQPVRIRGRVLYHRETLEAYIRAQSREGRE